MAWHHGLGFLRGWRRDLWYAVMAARLEGASHQEVRDALAAAWQEQLDEERERVGREAAADRKAG